MALKIGTLAPDFTLPADDGTDYEFHSRTKDQYVVIYFYPKDFTPGCTAEACEFRDSYTVFAGMNVTILGISRDNITSHQRFKQKFEIPYVLLSDSSGTVAKKYDALFPIVGIPKRTTYFVDRDQSIIHVISDLFNPQAHVQAMRDVAERLNP